MEKNKQLLSLLLCFVLVGNGVVFATESPELNTEETLVQETLGVDAESDEKTEEIAGEESDELLINPALNSEGGSDEETNEDTNEMNNDLDGTELDSELSVDLGTDLSLNPDSVEDSNDDEENIKTTLMSPFGVDFIAPDENGITTIHNEAQLIDTVNNSTVDLNISIASDYSGLSSSAIVKPNNINLTIDGNNVEFLSELYITGNDVLNDKTTEIKNMRFNGLSAISSEKVGVAIATAGTYIIDNISVKNSSNGAAISIRDAFVGSILIKNSEFTDNTRNQSGFTGAVLVAKSLQGTITIENSILRNNKTVNLGNGSVGGQGGAIHLINMGVNSEFNVYDSIFEGNTTGFDSEVDKVKNADGGAIGIVNTNTNSKVNLSGNLFKNNKANDDGGAIFIQTKEAATGHIRISNNTFIGNEAVKGDTSGASGGVLQIWASGDAGRNYTTDLELINNTFVGNKAGRFGGVMSFAGQHGNKTNLTMRNNILVGNTAMSSSTNIQKNTYVITDKISGNIGVHDTGANDNTVSVDKVFGAYAPELADNMTLKSAGRLGNRELIQTILPTPGLLADSAGDVLNNELAYDQRGFTRASDSTSVGSVQSASVTYDSNGGQFTLPDFTLDNELKYYEVDADHKTNTYSDIATLNQDTTVKSALNDFSGEKLEDAFPLIFMGWSNTALNVDVKSNLSVDYLAGATINHDVTERKLYAVWAQASVQVNYVDELGADLKTPVTFKGGIGKPYASIEETFSGYELKSVTGSKDGHLSDTDSVVTYVYNVKVDKGFVDVEYRDELGVEIATSTQLKGNVGSGFTSTPITIPGYTFLRSSNEIGLFTNTLQVATHTYKKDVVPSVEGLVNVSYLDENGAAIADPGTLKGFVGSPYNSVPLIISGYTFDTSVNASGFFTAANQVVTHHYVKNSAVITEGFVDVHYVDEIGNVIADASVLRGSIGDDFISYPIEIAGFTFKSSFNETGVFGAVRQDVTHTYTKNSAVTHNGNVLVSYLDEDGNAIAKQLNLKGEIGTEFISSPITIDGYTFVSSNMSKGVFSLENQKVIHTYKKNGVDKEIESGIVVVKYQNESGKDISKALVLKGSIGSRFSTKAINVKGYKLVKTVGDTEGVFTANQQELTFVYAEVTQTLPATGYATSNIAQTIVVLGVVLMLVSKKREMQ